MLTNFNTYEADILSKINGGKVENLDLLTAYQLGLNAATADKKKARAVAKAAHTKKRDLVFLNKFAGLVGCSKLTPARAEEVISSPILPIILKKANSVVGKEAVNEVIASEDITKPKYRRDFLEYYDKALAPVIDELIRVIKCSVTRMRKEVKELKSPQESILKTLYDVSNRKKSFLSVDLKQGNWTTLRHYDDALPEWEDFLDKALPDGQFKGLYLKSKNFRQVSLGSALKKLNATTLMGAAQVRIMSLHSHDLADVFGPIFARSNDELIFAWKAEQEEWLKKFFEDKPLFHLTHFTMDSALDDCFYVEYRDIQSGKEWWNIRLHSPEKIDKRIFPAM